MTVSPVQFRNRLAVRQARIAVISAVAIGTFFAIVQILLDAGEERDSLKHHAESVLDYAQLTAARAAYRLDPEAAGELAKSLLSDPAIVRVSIVDELNETMASSSSARTGNRSSLSGFLLGSTTETFTRDLTISDPAVYVGTLTIALDPVAAAPGFSKRTINAVVSGLLKSLFLSAFLLVIYHFMITKRITSLAAFVKPETTPKPTDGDGGDELDRLRDQVTAWSKQTKTALAEAESANTAKSVFLASMSHEMRTPLNAIIGYSEAMSMGIDGKDPEKRAEYLENIARGARQLNKLLGDILDFSQIEAGAINFNLSTFPPAEVIRNNLGSFREIVEQPGLTLDVAIETEAMIEVDRSKFRQILINFISNATKYNTENGTVRIGCTVVEDDQLRCYVEDTGIGIPAEQRAAVFEHFVRGTHHKMDIPGAGLGLAICKVMTEGMGGRIGCDGIANDGSRFWVEFPVVSVGQTQ